MMKEVSSGKVTCNVTVEGKDIADAAGAEVLWTPDKEERATHTTGGQKGRKLAEFALVPVEAREEVAKVYGYGASKYEPHNWRRGYPWSWSLSALYRHVAAFERGESSDPESGLHHLAHASFHLNTLMMYDWFTKGEDDRQ